MTNREVVKSEYIRCDTKAYNTTLTNNITDVLQNLTEVKLLLSKRDSFMIIKKYKNYHGNNLLETDATNKL